jgi:FAD/FMN-containing dehydrogenase
VSPSTAAVPTLSVAEAAEHARAMAATITGSPGPIVAVGARTHWGVGGPAPDLAGAVVLQAPSGIVVYDPAELTVTCGAGTPVALLDRVLAEAGQECPLDPLDGTATVGGVLAAGLSGPRRLRWGPLRERLLEARFVTGDGRVVKGGGPTVKNVTGFDVPRLLVGSLGTLGVIVSVTLRCQPRAHVSQWAAGPEGVGAPELRRRLFNPSCVASDRHGVRVLLEGHPDDVAAQLAASECVPVDTAPPAPEGPWRGRISVPVTAMRTVVDALGSLDAPGAPVALDASDGRSVAWLAEWGVGTVHVAASTPRALLAARAIAQAQGGWLLREAGALEVVSRAAGDASDDGNASDHDGTVADDGFGVAFPNAEIQRRLKAAFDPAGRCNPGRIPL